jgi:hypothetical protein
MSEEFEKMQWHFEALCWQNGIPVPDIRPALPTDPCDVTDPPYVRINLNQDCDRVYQVRHLFGHYLADLHAAENGRYADRVADLIASLLEP